MIIDPGIDIDKGYPAYDRGIKQDVFVKVRLQRLILYCINVIVPIGLQWEQLYWPSVAWRSTLS